MLSYPDCHVRAIHWLYWNSSIWSLSDVNVYYCLVKVTSSCNKASYKGHGKQEKEFIILYKGGIEKSPSLGMPISDPRDRFFYPTITLMINSYILIFRDE